MTGIHYESKANFSIKYLQFLNEKSEATQNFPAFADSHTLLYLYRQMALVRALDDKAVHLQRTGKIGTYPSSRGQEAVSIGIGHAMRDHDIFCPYYRDQGTFLMRGVELSNILNYWGGDERGSVFKKATEDFPTCVPIGTQLLHATGVAYAVKYRKQARVVLTICGDGGTSQGDFYEALNLAGDWRLPVVFVINNNQWAISVPRKVQTSAETLAQKAIAADIEGLQVDGNDVIAVHYAVREALEKARRGEGPTLIEAVTYRLCDHTTADDGKRYQPENEFKAAWKQEPIARLGYYLKQQRLWSRDQEKELQKTLTEQIERAVQAYQAIPKAKLTDMFDYLYADLPKILLKQRNSILKIIRNTCS